MPEQFNALLIALLFTILIGSWLLVNALVDLAARRVRRWLAAHWAWFSARWPDTEAQPRPSQSDPHPFS
ncbi:MAG: hypothetical protein ACRDJW_03775 [Thermomicrobiales bacterium]